MYAENWALVTNDSVDLEKSLVDVPYFKKKIDHFRGISKIYLKLIKNNQECQHVASWVWKH